MMSVLRWFRAAGVQGVLAVFSSVSAHFGHIEFLLSSTIHTFSKVYFAAPKTTTTTSTSALSSPGTRFQGLRPPVGLMEAVYLCL
jgi:hypothetical protein